MQIANYTKVTDSAWVDFNANKFFYQKSGTVLTSSNDWESRFTQTISFAIPSDSNSFKFCNTELKNIKANHTLKVESKLPKQKTSTKLKGCIEGSFKGNRISVTGEIDANYKFGEGLLKKEKAKVKFEKSIAFKKESFDL